MKKKLSHFIVFASLFIVALVLEGCKADAKNKKEIDKKTDKSAISVELSDESYGLEFCNYHTGWWENNNFYAYVAEALGHKKSYNGKIKKQAVEELLQNLDLKEKNLQEKLIGKAPDEEFEYNPNPELEGRTFLLYGIDTEEAVLIVTKRGEIYFQGTRYTGDKADFKEAFFKFIQKETADQETQQKQLLQCYNDIVWE